MKRYSASAGRNSIPPKKLRRAFCGLGCLKNGVLAVLGCMLLATTGTAQEPPDGTISLYSDSLFTTSEASDTAPGILTVYVVHDKMTTANGHVGTWFMVSGGGGFTGTLLDETVPHPVFLGSSPSGIIIAFGTCLSQPQHLLTIRYVLSGTSATDSYLQVLPHPDDGRIIVEDCNFWNNPATGGALTVNPSVVPTEATTWGRIKALYR